jgi:O-antigen ligase
VTIPRQSRNSTRPHSRKSRPRHGFLPYWATLLGPLNQRLASFAGFVQQDPILAATLALVLLATIFGGASQANALSLVVVELAALPLLFLAVFRLIEVGVERRLALPLILLAGLVAVPLLQLVPLPESIWSHLPGRAPEVAAVQLARLGHPEMPLSMAPDGTWHALLALLPPVAMFLAAIQLSDGGHRAAVALWLGLGVATVFIGLLQVIGGPDSHFYFYSITNPGLPDGLFANRNHEAAFLYCLLVLAFVFVIDLRTRATLLPDPLPAVLASIFISLCVLGAATTLSRAGIILTLAALGGCVVLALKARVFRGRLRLAALVAVPAIAGVTAVLLFGLSGILNRFDAPDAKDLRFEGWPIVLRTAATFAPAGSGIGSFDVVYRAVEPLDQVSDVYFNHAHNDYLELWLETGCVGAGLFAAFLIWLSGRICIAWSRQNASARADLSRASALALLLLLAHSSVDYPLRTEAIAVMFAFCCGVLAKQRRNPLLRARAAPDVSSANLREVR